TSKTDQKGARKKDNLGWEIIKLQAQVGETTSRKAKKAFEAGRKKEGAALSSTTTTTGGEDDSDADESSEQADKVMSEAVQKLNQLKEQKIKQKIYQAKKEIRRAFVKARTGETQRLIKRLKEAKSAVEKKGDKDKETAEEPVEEENTKPAHKKKQQDLTEEDVAKFEHEMQFVKKLDIDSLSERAFIAKLAKHPILATHALMQPYVGDRAVKKDQEVTTTTAATVDPLVQIMDARLTNAKMVRECMTKLWDEVEHIITGKKVDHEQLKNNKKRKAGGEQEEEQQETKKTKTKDTKGRKQQKQEDNDSDNSGEDEDDDETGYADMSDISDDEQDDGYDSDGEPLPRAGGKATTTSSMFLGSLNEGHSKKDKKNKKKDKNDWVDEKFDEIYGKIKKNRPGQRARREKAERKFGKEANHIKKAEEEARLREERKAARKAKLDKFKAKDASAANAQRLPNRRVLGAGDGSAEVVQQRPAVVKVPAGPDLNDPTLHPSWLAKQSEKAAMAAALSGAKSNKIVFDDSD
ncbi:hypothetical protein BGZ98_004652, partial [Dissophora globulifera]